MFEIEWSGSTCVVLDGGGWIEKCEAVVVLADGLSGDGTEKRLQFAITGLLKKNLCYWM